MECYLYDLADGISQKLPRLRYLGHDLTSHSTKLTNGPTEYSNYDWREQPKKQALSCPEESPSGAICHSKQNRRQSGAGLTRAWCFWALFDHNEVMVD
jgi:hypothetical protein